MKKVEGIIVNAINYGETSKVLNILTKEYGLIGVIAKGARNMKCPFRSFTDKLTYANFVIKYNGQKLSILKEVSIINSFKNIRKDINKISYAMYLLELSSQIIKQNEDKEILILLINTLIKIDEDYDPMVLMNILEIKYLSYLGVMPSIDKCVLCGSSTDIVTLSSYSGGYICRNCHTTEQIVSSKTIKLIRLFYYVDILKISKLNVSDEVKKEINNFLNDYYERYTGIYLKSKNFIEILQKIN